MSGRTDLGLKTLGLIVSGFYIIALMVGVWLGVASESIVLSAISLNELGDLLAGVFGPIAILWVVLGFFQQSRELRNSVEALNNQSLQLERSAKEQSELAAATTKQIDQAREFRILDGKAKSFQVAIQISSKLDELPKLLSRANDSRIALLSSNSMLESGRFGAWKEELKELQKTNLEFSEAYTALMHQEHDYDDLVANGNLEVRLRQLLSELENVEASLLQSLAADQTERDNLRFERNML